jgi:hypothetical protein
VIVRVTPTLTRQRSDVHTSRSSFQLTNLPLSDGLDSGRDRHTIIESQLTVSLSGHVNIADGDMAAFQPHQQDHGQEAETSRVLGYLLHSTTTLLLFLLFPNLSRLRGTLRRRRQTSRGLRSRGPGFHLLALLLAFGEIII